jgi:hypothetical protein
MGGLLLFLGVMGFLIELKHSMPSSRNFQGYVLAAAFAAGGAATCGAARFHYWGGLWSFAGIVCVTGVIFRFANAIQIGVRGGFVVDPFDFYSKTAALWVVGCYCLIWGHMRRHRRKGKDTRCDVT